MMWNLGVLARPTLVGSKQRDVARRKFFETIGLPRRIEQLTNGVQTSGRKSVGSSGRIRTYNPSVNSRMLYH